MSLALAAPDPILLEAGHPCSPCPVRARSACRGLKAGLLRRLKEGGRDVRLEAGQSLWRQGDSARGLFTLRAGLVRTVSSDQEGREQILSFHLPGDIIGLTARERHCVAAEAVVPSLLCQWPAGSAARPLLAEPALAAALLAEALAALDRARERSLCLARRPATGRLAWFLVQLHDAAAREGGEPGMILLPMDRAAIAAHIGLTREAVSRSFTRLKADGMIAERRGGLQLLSPAGLRLLAGLD